MENPRAQTGLSLVELMVGLAVGAGVVVATLTWFAEQHRQGRALATQAHVRQELVTLSRLLTSWLRHAGYAGTPVALQAGASPKFAEVDLAPDAIRLHLDRNHDGRLDANDTLAFTLVRGQLTLRIGHGTAQALSDTGVVRVTRFAPRLEHTVNGFGTCTARIRWRLEGRSTLQPHLIMSLEGSVIAPNLASQTCRS